MQKPKVVYEKDFKEKMCPVCKSKKIRYSNYELLSKEVLADWDCSECNSYGSLSYGLSFLTYNNAQSRNDGEEIEIIYNKE